MTHALIRNAVPVRSGGNPPWFQRFGQASLQMPPSPLEKGRHRLGDHRHSHAEQQHNRGRANKNVESLEHGPSPRGQKSSAAFPPFSATVYDLQNSVTLPRRLALKLFSQDQNVKREYGTD